MKITAISIIVGLLGLVTSACSNPSNNSSLDPTPLNWRSYLPSPKIDGINDVASNTNGSIVLKANNPFADGAAVVFLGTPPNTTTPVLANTPYALHGSGQTSFTLSILGTGSVNLCKASTNGDFMKPYTIVPLDWTVLTTSTFYQNSGIFSLNSHGFAVGDSVYLDGNDPNGKTAGAYVVTSVSNANSFTLSGAKPNGTIAYRFLAKINQTPGAKPF